MRAPVQRDDRCERARTRATIAVTRSNAASVRHACSAPSYDVSRCRVAVVKLPYELGALVRFALHSSMSRVVNERYFASVAAGIDSLAEEAAPPTRQPRANAVGCSMWGKPRGAA